MSNQDCRAPLTVVFILSAPRSGSTWLNLVLGSCSWAHNLGEYFRMWAMPGTHACRLCEADGLETCVMLDGIQAVDRQDAFPFAAARSGKNVLIDCSKSIPWSQSFLDQSNLEIRFLHLVRHPGGYVESQSRRAPDMSYADLLNQWEAQNREIAQFVAGTKAPAMMVAYDNLAEKSEEHFPDVCRFIGNTWEPQALKYWEVPHHGLGANGAASVFLRDRKVVNYLSGDEGFYANLKDKPTAADHRFRERLPEDVRLAAVDRPYARLLNEQLHANWQP